MDPLNSSYMVLYFNSQPHKEADDATGGFFFFSQIISTHSLTRRLTAILNKFSYPKLHSNCYKYPIVCINYTNQFQFFFIFVTKTRLFQVRISWDFMGTWDSHYRIRGVVTSNPAFAPICSTLFLYFSPR